MKKGELTKSLRNEGWVPFESREYEVKDDDGNVVGKIGYKAAKAINEGRLFKYTPNGADEEKVFSYLRKKQNDAERAAERSEYIRSTATARKTYVPNTIENAMANTGEIGRNKNNDGNVSIADELFSLAKNKSNSKTGNFEPAEVPNLHDRYAAAKVINDAVEKSKPEEGSYEYYVREEKNKRAELESTQKQLDKNYSVYDIENWRNAKDDARKSGNEADFKNDKVLSGIDRLMKRKSDLMNDYTDISANLDRIEENLSRNKEDGTVNTEKVKKYAPKQKERSEVIQKYSDIPYAEMPHTQEPIPSELQEDYASATNAEEKEQARAEIENYYLDPGDPVINSLNESEKRGRAGAEIAEDIIKAAEYYDKNVNNTYGDNPFGRGAANYRLGRNEIEKNSAAYTAYKYGNTNLTAADIYNSLSERLQQNSPGAFSNRNAFDTAVANIAQYIPQGIDQFIEGLKGQAVGAAVGLILGGVGSVNQGRRIGSAAFSAKYMFEQTAGAMYYDLIKDYDMSPEDAKMLSSNNAIVSSVIEFGLDYAVGKLLISDDFGASGAVAKEGEKGIKSALDDGIVAHVIKKVMPESKITGALVKAGVSEAGAKKAVKIAVTAGKYAISSLGEGAEEWLQQGGEIVAKRYAKEGKSISPSNLMAEIFDFSKYTDEDFQEMNTAFIGGMTVGFASHIAQSGVANTVTRKVAEKLANYSDSIIVGIDTLQQANGTEIIQTMADNAIKFGDDKTAKKARRLLDKYNGGTASTAQIGELVKLGIKNTGENAVSAQNLDDAANTNNITDEEAISDTAVNATESDPESVMHDVKENLSAGGAVQSAENTVRAVSVITDNIIGEFSRTGVDVSDTKSAIERENLRVISSLDEDIDEAFVRRYADSFALGLERNNSTVYRELSKSGGNIGQMLTDYIIRGRVPQGMKDSVALKRAADKLKEIVQSAVSYSMAAKGKVFGDENIGRKTAESILSGDFSGVSAGNETSVHLTRVGEHYEAYGADAAALARLAGVSTYYKSGSDGRVLTAGVPVSWVNENTSDGNAYSAERYNADGKERIVLSKNEIVDFPEFTNDMLYEDEEMPWEKTTENEKITIDMSDDARAEILNKKSINVVSVDTEKAKALDNVDFDALQNSYPSYARPIIKKIARDFGILNESFFNPDIELEFSYSGDSIQESINKQHSRYDDFVKMLSVFSDVIENAVGVETHEDKYVGTRREDTNLKQMYVLASAFSDEKGVYPVKLEVKEFKKNTNKLYLSVVLAKKESRDLSGNLGQNQLNTAPPASIISIADLVGIVNPSEGDFLKYFPDSMLDSEQIEGKNKALAKDAVKVEKLKTPLNNEENGTEITKAESKTEVSVSGKELYRKLRERYGNAVTTIRKSYTKPISDAAIKDLVNIAYTLKRTKILSNPDFTGSDIVDSEALSSLNSETLLWVMTVTKNGFYDIADVMIDVVNGKVNSEEAFNKIKNLINNNLAYQKITKTGFYSGENASSEAPAEIEKSGNISENSENDTTADNSPEKLKTENVIFGNDEIEINAMPTGEELDAAVLVARFNGVPVYLNGNDKLGEIVLSFDGDNVSENAIKDDIRSYFDGVMPKYVQNDNKYYSKDEELRFSISTQNSENDASFSLSEPEEETKNLIAVHNLSAKKLEGTLELGGFPMPSIAVAKDTIGHENFGDISIVFYKDTIDPKANEENKVYSADAWTPVFPPVEYEANSDKVNEIRNKYLEISRKYGHNATRALYKYSDVSNIEDKMNSVGGERNLIEDAKLDVDLMQVFLYDIGAGKVEPIEKKTVSKISDSEAREYDYFIEKLGKDAFGEMRTNPEESPIKARKEWFNKYGEKFDNTLREYLSERFGFSEEQTDNVVNAETTASKSKKVIKIKNYMTNGKETVSTEYDYSATADAIKKLAAENGFEDWVDNLLTGVEKSKGLYNGKDPYTNMGDRKSFSQLHYDVTLENIVKAMKTQGDGDMKNVSGFHGIKTLRAASAKTFKNIADIHNSEGKIKNLSEEEAQEINDRLGERLSNIINYIYAKKAHSQYENNLIEFDRIGEMITECCELEDKSPENIKALFKNYRYDIDNKVANGIVQLLFDVAQMPVHIFEAKPGRVVSFDEIAFAAVPKGKYPELKRKLEGKGIKVKEYDPDVDGSRLDVLNSEPDVKFSVSRGIDADRGIRYNEDIDIPYREMRQLREYIMSENNRNDSELKTIGCKEIGDNFYIWRNRNKTDFDVLVQVEIDGNEDLIDFMRGEVENGTFRTRESIRKAVAQYNGRFGMRYRSSVADTNGRAEVGNGSVSDGERTGNGFGHSGKSDRNQQNKEVSTNETEGQRGGEDNLLHGDMGRSLSESSGKQGGNVYEGSGSSEKNGRAGQNAARSRRLYGESVRRNQGVSTEKHGRITADIVKEEFYTDEMRRIADDNKAVGANTYFFLGDGRDSLNENVKFRGAINSKGEIFVCCDNEMFSPETINRHERVHLDYQSEKTQAVARQIINSLNGDDLKRIKDVLYARYRAVVNGDMDKILEEFVCDVLSGMNEYAQRYEDVSKGYWNENDTIDRYNPSEYTESIDAGGANADVINSTDFGNGFSLGDDYFDIPYNEKRQLQDYIMRKNHSSNSLESVDCKEIGNNFYVWKNNSKTDYTVISMTEIDGNEDFIDVMRGAIENGTYRGAESFNAGANRIRSRKRSSTVLNADDERTTTDRSNDRISVGQSSSDKVGRFSESGRDKQAGDKTKYALNPYDNGGNVITANDVKAVQSIPRKSVNGFTSNEIQKTESFARKYFNEMGTKSPFFRGWFGDWRANDTTIVNVANKKGAVRGITKNIDTGWDIQISGKVFNESRHSAIKNQAAIPYLDYINSIVENAVLLDSYTVPSANSKSANSAMMHSLYAIADIGNGREVIKLYVEELNDVNNDGTITRAYQLQNITKQQLRVQSSQNIGSSITSTANTYTVSQLFNIVKRADANFNPNNASKVVNADGTPKIMYRGDTNMDFTVFDRKKSRSSNLYGRGFYFTESESNAGTYGKPYPFYLKIENPLIFGEHNISKAQLVSFLKAVAKNEDDYDIWNYGTTDINKIAASLYGKGDLEMLQDISATAIGDLVEAIELFNSVNKTNYDGIITDTETIVFDSTQIKSATDNIGTFDGNNPDIRFSIGDEREYLKSPIEKISNDIKSVRLQAELRQGKVFERKDVNAVRDSILNNISIGDTVGIEMTSKAAKAEMSVYINRALNAAGKQAREKHARALARYIAQNASAYDNESLLSDGGIDFEGDRATVLGFISHGIKLSEDAKAAIISAVGERSAKGYIALMSNKDALGVDSVYDELAEVLPGYFPSDVLGDGNKMRRILEVYTWLNEGRQRKGGDRLIDVMDEEDAKKFVSLIYAQISEAFETGGRDSALKRERDSVREEERAKYEKYAEELSNKYDDKIAKMRKAAKNKAESTAKKKKISVKQERYNFKSLDEAISKFGRIKEGETPYREVAIPKKISESQPISRFARTLAESEVLPETAMSEFEERILDGSMSYEKVTDKDALKKAEEIIKRDGFKKSLDYWDGLIANNTRIGKVEFALGQLLFNQCVTAKDTQRAMKIAVDLAHVATQAGQVVQASRLIKQMSPDAQLYSLESSVMKLQEEFDAIQRRYNKKHGDLKLTINKELEQKYITAENEEQREAIMDEILQDVADQIPSTLKDKWDSWRYLSMLFNPKTHIRNILGNLFFTLPVRIKNCIGWVMEKSIDKDKRTKAIKSSKANKDFAEKDYAKIRKDLAGGGGKYESINSVDEKRQIFKFKPLEALRKMNFYLLEAEDGIFLKHHYKNSMAQVMTARGYTAEFLSSGTAEANAALDQVRKYAFAEAQKATYRDASELASWLNTMQRDAQKSRNPVKRSVGYLVEGAIPFKKTPLNILKRGIEYSPIGVIQGVYDMVKGVKNENFTASEAIDKLASGISGSALMALGIFLASLGFVKGDDDDDDATQRIDSMTGVQNYSLIIGNKSYTIDWMAPMSLPFFVGVNIYSLFNQDEEVSFESIFAALKKLPDPLLNLSVLSSLNDILNAGQYVEEGKALAVAGQAATSYVQQAFPSVLGQVARTVDSTKRNAYYDDPENGIPSEIERFCEQMMAKTPGLSTMLEPKVDMWGRLESYGDTAFGRFFGNFISPGYYKEIISTELDDELRRLNDEYDGEGSVLPSKAPKNFKYGGVRYNMTDKEHTKFAIIKGQRSFELADELIRTEEYKKKTPEEKKKALEKCYDAARDEAKTEILKDRGVEVE